MKSCLRYITTTACRTPGPRFPLSPQLRFFWVLLTILYVVSTTTEAAFPSGFGWRPVGIHYGRFTRKSRRGWLGPLSLCTIPNKFALAISRVRVVMVVNLSTVGSSKGMSQPPGLDSSTSFQLLSAGGRCSVGLVTIRAQHPQAPISSSLVSCVATTFRFCSSRSAGLSSIFSTNSSKAL